MRIGATALLGEFEVTPLHLHLLAMGFSPGMEVKVIRRFPMKGNLYVRIGNRNVIMRDVEASQLSITQLN